MSQKRDQTIRARKSTHSTGNPFCIRVGRTKDGTPYLYDDADPHGSVIHTDKGSLDAFLKGAKDGEFDEIVE